MAGAVLGSVIAVEPTGATAVPGVFAAGNATDISMTLMASAAHGNRVGAWINAELAAADAARAVEARRAELFERPAWEERYSGDRVWSGRVNPQLAAEAADLAPGRALDIGSGEGGDALWLAGQGWDVTAVDFADAALARTAEHADEAGVGDRVGTRRVDVRSFEPSGETWDLVSSQFMHLPDGGMPDLVRRLASAVAPGGTLLVVGHHPERPGDRDAARPPLVPLHRRVAAAGAARRLRGRGVRGAHPHAGAPAHRRGDHGADAVLRARRVA